MTESTNLRGVCEIFLRYTKVIHRKSHPKDPNFLKISVACGKIEQFIESIFPSSTTPTVAQLALEAEKKQRQAQKMTPEEKREMYFIYAAIAGVWVVLLLLMTIIAYIFGARFDHLFEGFKKLYLEMMQGGGVDAGKEVVEGTPGRVEL
jgi:farnesyl-diphosphate farnesyltransferase